jgi:hypothetical protein
MGLGSVQAPAAIWHGERPRLAWCRNRATPPSEALKMQGWISVAAIVGVSAVAAAILVRRAAHRW